MFRHSSTLLAFVAGLVLAGALVHVAPTGRESATQAVLMDTAPWTQHRASVLLAQETSDMQDLRDAARLAQVGATAGRR
jgi:hypothetical protein